MSLVLGVRHPILPKSLSVGSYLDPSLSFVVPGLLNKNLYTIPEICLGLVWNSNFTLSLDLIIEDLNLLGLY